MDHPHSCTCGACVMAPVRNPATEVQQGSVANSSTAIADLVLADIGARDAFGAKKYGTRLQANNGRDALMDAYQEALDLVFYLRQELEERRQRLLAK
jgi:hypothetical protein